MTDDAVRAMMALAGVALTQEDIDAAMVEICRIATQALPVIDGASVTTFPQGKPGALADSDWAQTLDELQYAEHEGPCLDAYRTGNAFRVRDLAVEPRWPSYTPRAVERGARSMMSLPMAAEGSTIGALNLYSRKVDAIDADSVSIAEVMAAHAGLASQVSSAFFGHRDLAEQMRDAMGSRAVIEQAKGIIMRDRCCSADEAFRALARLSQDSNVKL